MQHIFKIQIKGYNENDPEFTHSDTIFFNNSHVQMSQHSESYLWKVILSARGTETTKNLGTVNLSLGQDFNLSSPDWKTASQSTATFRKKLQLYNT